MGRTPVQLYLHHLAVPRDRSADLCNNNNDGDNNNNNNSNNNNNNDDDDNKQITKKIAN